MMKKNHRPLTVVEWNVGDGGRLGDLRGVEFDILDLVEVSDQKKLLASLVKQGFILSQFDEYMGQAATAQVLNPETMKLIAEGSTKIADGSDLGEGPGPDDGKDKFLHTITARHLATERVVNNGLVHLYAGQRWGKNHNKPNVRATRSYDALVAVDELMRDMRGIKRVVGDLNAELESPTLDPMFDHGWVSSHLVLGELPTMSSRGIDHQLHLRGASNIEFWSHYIRGSHSDHNIYAVVEAVRLGIKL